jgi:hypothetical protein
MRRLVQPDTTGGAINIATLIPASVPPILPPVERPGDRKIARKIKLLIDTEANKMKVNTGKNGIDPPMPSIFAKYYIAGHLDNTGAAASKAKNELDELKATEKARQNRLVPRKCVVPHGDYSNASKWAELYDALDLAISPLPLRPIAPAPVPAPLATKQRPLDTDTNELYEWENARYREKVPYRLADRNRYRR